VGGDLLVLTFVYALYDYDAGPVAAGYRLDVFARAAPDDGLRCQRVPSAMKLQESRPWRRIADKLALDIPIASFRLRHKLSHFAGVEHLSDGHLLVAFGQGLPNKVPDVHVRLAQRTPARLLGASANNGWRALLGWSGSHASILVRIAVGASDLPPLFSDAM
jgi:hypothetical protein